MSDGRSWEPGTDVVGGDLEVPIVGGGQVRYSNLDHAASTPALVEVWRAVEAFMPWYSSVHRGAGFKSQVATAAYEAARVPVRAFLHARPDDAVVFTRNTTDAVNLLARSLPSGTAVITTAAEHHANLLPWRRYANVVQLPVPASLEEALQRMSGALRALRPRAPALVAVTGASNVTGEIWPIRQMAALAHEQGARIFVDAAQLAPHRPIDLSALDLDWVAISGHKLYAPFGVGALVGRKDWLGSAEPYLLGGGAVDEVTEHGASWAGLPERHEGGSPNVVGAVALAAACSALQSIGMANVARRDRALSDQLQCTLDNVPGVVVYRAWRDATDRVAVRAFDVQGHSPTEVAAVLSAEHGIGVRSGSFCAHPLLTDLAKSVRKGANGCGKRVPGAVRASLGLGSRRDDLERLEAALREIVGTGPRWRYRATPDGDVVPEPDDRPWPLPAMLFSAIGLPALAEAKHD